MSSDRRSYDSSVHHLDRPDSTTTTTDTTTTTTTPPPPPPQLPQPLIPPPLCTTISSALCSISKVQKTLVGWSVVAVPCRSIFMFPRILSVFILLRTPIVGAHCTALALRHSTLSAWRRAIFCAVLMFPGILAPGLVPGGPGPGINHAFPDQAARVQRPRHYRGQ